MKAISSEHAFKHSCPWKMSGALDYIHCEGDRCMAWRKKDGGLGYCGLVGDPDSLLGAQVYPSAALFRRGEG